MNKTDFNDYTIYVHSNGKKERRFKSYCLTCNKDRGYVRRSRLNKDCHSCNSKKMAAIGKNHNGQIDDIKTNNSKLSSKMNSIWWKKRRLSGNYRTKEHSNIRKRFASILRSRLKNRQTSKRGYKTFDILGYTLKDLVSHLESKFYPNPATGEMMTWKNYGYWGWHVDHVVPDSYFKYKSIEDEEFKRSWSLENLQPMWRMENLKKGAKYDI